jgi:hypothetical protein
MERLLLLPQESVAFLCWFVGGLFNEAPSPNTPAHAIMASFFKQLSDDMEKVIQVVEEGAKFMMGESARMGEQGSDAASPSDPTTTFGDGASADPDGDVLFDDMDEDMYGSPLMGMADSVMSDIMSMQVCGLSNLRHFLVNNCRASSPSFI